MMGCPLFPWIGTAEGAEKGRKGLKGCKGTKVGAAAICSESAESVATFGASIDFLVRADVDEEQNLRTGFRMSLFGKNNSAIVSHGTRVKSGQGSAQVVRFQTGIIEVFRHAPQRGLD
jgi:hypothetical protein